MPEYILSMLAVIHVFCQSRSDTALEILALRQQVAALKRQAATPSIEHLGPTVLDDAPPPLVPRERGARHREAQSLISGADANLATHRGDSGLETKTAPAASKPVCAIRRETRLADRAAEREALPEPAVAVTQ